MDPYISTLNLYQIAYHSVKLDYDLLNNKKICKHPPRWQHITFNPANYNPALNAIIQITGKTSNILVVDIDGVEHSTNRELINLCTSTCKFYNKTNKGYHFIYKYNPQYPTNKSYKYPDDPTNSGFDIKSTNGCIYYGSYYIGPKLITYQNITADAIVDMPLPLIEKLNLLLGMKTKKPSFTNTTSILRNHNATSTIISDFPIIARIDLPTLDTILECIPAEYFTNYNEWVLMAIIIKHTNTSALPLFTKYSKQIPQYANSDNYIYMKLWNTIKYDPTFKIISLLHIARKANPSKFNKIDLKFITHKFHSSITPSQTFHSQYLNFDEINTHIKNGNHIIAIKSPYGTGKSFFLSKLFSSQTPTTRILIITSRITLSYSMQENFPSFTHYHTNTNTNLKLHNKLIIQLDSLNRINPFNKYSHNCLPSTFINNITNNTNNPNNELFRKENVGTVSNKYYNIIALDEIESLLAHLSYKNLNASNIFSILVNLCINAQQIIALDGDLGERAVLFLKYLAAVKPSLKTPFIIENTYKTDPKHFIFTNDKTGFNKKIETDLEQGKKIVIIAMSVSISENYFHQYHNKYQTILHNSIQNNKEGLKNINTYWSRAQLLIYTSTIEAGCDFSVEHFDYCYIILSDKSCSARSLMQMISRVRKYKSNIVNVYNNEIPFYEYCFPYQYEEVEASLMPISNNNDEEINNGITNDITDASTSCNEQSKVLKQILIYNQVESLNRNYFITILCQLIRMKGHTYEYEKKKYKNKKKDKNMIYLAIAEAEIIESDLRYQEYVTYIKNFNDIFNDGFRTINLMIKKYAISKIWHVDINSLNNAGLVETYYPKMQVLFNHYKYIKYIKSIQDGSILNSLNSDNNDSSIEKLKYIVKLLNLFGANNTDYFKFSVGCGVGEEARKINKKHNPNFIKSDDLKSKVYPVVKEWLNDPEFRIVYEMKKKEGDEDFSEKKLYETTKTILEEYGVVIIENTVFKKSRDEFNNRITSRSNEYLLDYSDIILKLKVEMNELYNDLNEIEEYDF